jgi:hypothetical protein
MEGADLKVGPYTATRLKAGPDTATIAQVRALCGAPSAMEARSSVTAA